MGVSLPLFTLFRAYRFFVTFPLYPSRTNALLTLLRSGFPKAVLSGGTAICFSRPYVRSVQNIGLHGGI